MDQVAHEEEGEVTLAQEIESEIEELEEQIDSISDIAETSGVYLFCEAWDEEKYIPLTEEDLGALIDRRVETENELEHQLNAIESED